MDGLCHQGPIMPIFSNIGDKRPPKKHTNGACDHEPIKKRLTTDSKPKSIVPLAAEKNSEDNPQPRWSSCTMPAMSAASMATMIEQKLVNAVSSYEPLVLTRCTFEPMKTAAAKLMPESCLWKNAVGKLEPHRQATVVGIDTWLGFHSFAPLAAGM
ncbi:uncharacterized protein Fot_41708 [Forsythia ovata]|uniref:Uncharacterized protein n=1 Tax=Forsythia ovata TaxID=205694 RepID=A0ABD1RJS1_9LAMI